MFPEQFSKGDNESEKIKRDCAVGEYYRGMVQNAVGDKMELSDVDISSDERNFLSSLRRGAEEGFSEQQKLFEESDMNISKLLMQAYPNAPVDALLANNFHKIENPAKGVFHVHIGEKTFQQLNPGRDAQAMAVKVKGGVSFVLIPHYGIEDIDKNILSENLPHETHHILWYKADGDSVFKSSERDPHFIKAFNVFRDEILARLVSEGSLFGYTHLRLMGEDEQVRFEMSNKETHDALQATAIRLNTLLEDIQKLLTSTGTPHSFLTKSVMFSTNFNELEASLRERKEYLDTLPKKKDEGSTGWNTV